jgi:glycosyltransferase involved in cell wall biosynthesis
MTDPTNIPELSIVIPAKNEANAIAATVTIALSHFPAAEVVVIDDGSTDDTGELAREAGAKVIRHPESLGNGAAVKAGARAAQGELLAFMDADGQHNAAELKKLIKRLDEGYQMTIGARD